MRHRGLHKSQGAWALGAGFPALELTGSSGRRVGALCCLQISAEHPHLGCAQHHLESLSSPIPSTFPATSPSSGGQTCAHVPQSVGRRSPPSVCPSDRSPVACPGPLKPRLCAALLSLDPLWSLSITGLRGMAQDGFAWGYPLRFIQHVLGACLHPVPTHLGPE